MKRSDSEIENSMRSEAAAHARPEILPLRHGKQPALATSFADLLGDGGPTDETAEEMIKAIREWRDTPSNKAPNRSTNSRAFKIRN